jgi:5'-3' exonuclease
VRVTRQPYIQVKDTIVVDLSWVMYRSRYAMMNLSVTLPDGTVVPTGHLQGTLLTVAQLSSLAPRVLLAVDSPCPDRFKVFSGYKANRKKENPDGTKDFPIKIHTNLILAAATALPNVFFIKREGYEADDLINHIIAQGHDPVVFGTDNDLMQNEQPFRMARNVNSGVLDSVDIPAYISQKYKVPLPFLPIWYKTIRGDSSDNLPPAIPRYNGKKLSQLCVDLKGTREFESFLHYVNSHHKLLDESIQFDLLRNYMIVRPKPIFVEDAPLVEMRMSDFPVGEQLLNFQMIQILEYYNAYHNVRFL